VDGALTGIAPIRPLQLCADGGYQLRLGVLGVPLIMVPDMTVVISVVDVQGRTVWTRDTDRPRLAGKEQRLESG
jgi:hypothetical protein